MLVILLSSSLALAGGYDRTTDFTSRSDDDGRTEECEKTKAGCADDDPCPRPGECFEDDISTNYEAYARSLDGMIDALTAPVGQPIVQLGLGHTELMSSAPTGPSAPIGDVWTEEGNDSDYHFVEHWFLDDPSGLSAPAGFEMAFAEHVTDEAVMADILDDQVDYEDDTYIRMDVRYASIPSTVSSANLNYVGAMVDRHVFRGFRVDMDGNEVVSCRLLREIHYDASGNVARRLDHWVLFGDDVDTILVEKVGQSLRMEVLNVPEPTAKTFFAWIQENDTHAAKRAAIIEYTYANIYQSPLFQQGIGL